MSLSKTIVTNNVPGCNNLVSDGKNGFLSKAKDTNDLFNCMEKVLLLSKFKRDLMGKSSRKLVMEKYSNKVINTKFLKLFKKFV